MATTNETIDIQTTDGPMATPVYRPTSDGPLPRRRHGARRAGDRR